MLLERRIETQISDRASVTIVELLDSIYSRYSDESSEEYRPHHNHEHTLKVIDRTIVLWKVFSELLPDHFRDEDIELLLIAAAGHDYLWWPGAEDGEAERASSEQVAIIMRSNGYTEESIIAVCEMIEATIVSREGNHIRQTSLRKGSKDPRKYILATADINGIAMEGKMTMYSDVFSLYKEITQYEGKKILFKPQILVNLLLYQRQFLKDRIEAYEEDLLFYFEDDFEKVKEVLDTIFLDTFTEAFSEATVLTKNSTIAWRAIHATIGGAAELTLQTGQMLDNVKRELAGKVRPHTKP